VKSDDIIQALDGVGKKWTRQIKAEERRPAARRHRASMYTVSRRSLKSICFEHMREAWDKASDGGRLPTHWRQVFYVMRPLCDEHPHSDRPLLDTTFKNILESYLEEYQPGWDVLRGARGVFKEPHAADNDNGLALSTMNVRGYQAERASPTLNALSWRFPTAGAENRIAAVLICEKEGFDELLMAEQVPERFDLALMSTKGISAIAARDLARGLGVPCFTLHDLDKNGFVMAAGFPFATDIGIHMEDVDERGLAPEDQYHQNQAKTYDNLIRNGATQEEAEFVSQGQRVELNMLTGPEFIEFVEGKLEQHGVEKVVPDEATLAVAWKRAHLVARVNELIDSIQRDEQEDGSAPPATSDIPPVPGDLAERIREALAEDVTQPWDQALWDIVRETTEDEA
jgi:hypothetical protein